MIRREIGLPKTTALLSLDGIAFDYAAPRSRDVRLENVIRALSREPRFGGQSGPTYSVAEHSVLTAQIAGVLWLASQGNPAPGAVIWAALLHDAHEAYTGDLPTPAKRALGEAWRVFEARIEAVVHEALEIEDTPIVRAADALAYQVERRYVYGWGDVELESEMVDQAIADGKVITPGGRGELDAGKLLTKAILALPTGRRIAKAEGWLRV